MKIVRVLLHGLALLFANLTGVWLGFVVYHFLKPAKQAAIQFPIAVIVSILLFLVWTLLLRKLPLKKMYLQSASEFVFTFFCSLAWNPIVFVPLHYVTQGYVTDPGNVISLWIFQIPVNMVTVLIAMKATKLSGTHAFATPPGS